jgi:hypothetical protein
MVTLATRQRIMAGMWPRRREFAPVRRFLATALAVALFHQLGACPCGCIEGNLWVQSYLRLTGAALTPKAEAGPSAPGQHGVDAGECDDDHAQVAYVTGDSARGTHSVALIEAGWDALPNDVVAIDQRVSLHRVRGALWPSAEPSARTLRALLQIFLI